MTLFPMLGAVGAGIDLTRAIIVNRNLSASVDSAALAIGAQPGLSQAQAQALAQQYLNANYSLSNSFGTPAAPTVSISGQTVVVTATNAMPTTVMGLLGIPKMNLRASSTVVWGQTKLRVALVLDNTGSMSETDSSGASKMSALITATNQLLTMLQGASANAGDVQVSLIPFSKDVNVGAGNSGASWIDWTDWESAPANATTMASGTNWSDFGPTGGASGTNTGCPWSSSRNGYTCQDNSTNDSSWSGSIPATGVVGGVTITGPICPTADSGSKNTGRSNRYYNGCYDSVGTPNTTTSSSNSTGSSTTVCNKKSTCTVANYCTGYPQTGSPSATTTQSGASTIVTTTQTTTTCACSGSGSNKSCTTTPTTTTTVATTVPGKPYTHTWYPNSHSTWSGCIMDRGQSYDVDTTAPTSTSTNFPAENIVTSSGQPKCYPSPAVVRAMGYDWTALHNAVNIMSPNGNTNQTIGLDWGMMSQMTTAPLYSPSLPANTSQYIILLSDGLNTQNRWSSTQSSIDARMALACSNAKAAGFIIYTIYVDLAGTQGNSTVLQNCASDASKYFDLTTSGAIVTTLSQIGQQITNLRVSQ